MVKTDDLVLDNEILIRAAREAVLVEKPNTDRPYRIRRRPDMKLLGWFKTRQEALVTWNMYYD